MFREGDQFDRYRIEACLGEGGMGVVYRAFDTRLRRRVALKLVHPELTREQDEVLLREAIHRLVREGRASAALNHPNAVAVLDVGEVDGTPFIAMELVEGRLLSTYLGDERVPLRTRIEWLAAIARGLAAAHERGLVHRDVKPENVMICDDGLVKVLDFGVVKRLASSDVSTTFSGGPSKFQTHAGVVVGTPMYMSPEQVLGDVLDGRSDQFAWGLVAYELLSGGTHPTATNNPRNLPAAFAIVQEEPLPLRQVARAVPRTVEAIVMRALAKEPKDRFADMDRIAAALEDELESGDPAPPRAVIVAQDDADDDARADAAKTLAMPAQSREETAKTLLRPVADRRRPPVVVTTAKIRRRGRYATFELVLLAAVIGASIAAMVYLPTFLHHR